MDANANPSKPPGLVLHAAAAYDAIVWLFTLGRERAFRRNILRLARLQPGESVLDAGCGTGSLALEARRLTGSGGSIHGIDASPEMIARAVRKARKAQLDVDFQQAPVQALPFEAGRFDLVLNTMMLHHLPRPSRLQCAREMHRVLKPGGRLLVVDFASSTRGFHGLLSRFHRHGHVDPVKVQTVVKEAGFEIVESGEMGFRNLNYVLATPGLTARK